MAIPTSRGPGPTRRAPDSCQTSRKIQKAKFVSGTASRLEVFGSSTYTEPRLPWNRRAARLAQSALWGSIRLCADKSWSVSGTSNCACIVPGLPQIVASTKPSANDVTPQRRCKHGESFQSRLRPACLWAAADGPALRNTRRARARRPAGPPIHRATKCREKGSKPGHPGASGYAPDMRRPAKGPGSAPRDSPGHRIAGKGSVKGEPGASGYAPGRSK